MKKSILTLLSLASASMLSAQLYIYEPEILNTTGVSNDGVVIGYGTAGGTPFFLWDALNGTVKEIGGAAPGDGIGGAGRISADGKRAFGSFLSEAIPVNSEWVGSDFADYNGCHFKKIVYMSDWNVFAIGTDAEGTRGVVLKTVNNGVSWLPGDYVSDSPDGITIPHPILCGTSTRNRIFFGAEGALYMTTGNGVLFPTFPVVNGEQRTPKAYNAIDFLEVEIGSLYGKYSVFAVENEEGKPEVWYSTDEANTYSVGTGVESMPLSLTHVDRIYWMGTENGDILFSTDYGATWSKAFTIPGGLPVTDLAFSDDDHGVALCGGKVYITSDGGAEWTAAPTDGVSLNPLAGGFAWNDVMCLGEVMTIVGNDGRVVRSKDYGKSFTEITLPGSPKSELGAVYCFNDIYNILGDGGVFYRKSEVPDVEGYAASFYNADTEEWTPMETLGYDLQGNYSSCYGISEDGRYAAGIIRDVYKPNNEIQAYAGVWDNGKETKLPKMYEDRNMQGRANAVSFDGSVVAGWQDMFGPWFGSVWRRGADGNYTQSLMFEKEEDRDKDVDYINDKLTSISMLLGFCQCVSNDGKWIGGNGAIESATQAPWIWNEDKGTIVIGEYGNTGCVADIANDGSMAIGWDGSGQGAWIWTEEMGKVELNTYATDHLHIDLGDFFIVSVYDMSPNGRYVTGWGFDGGEPRAYVLDLKPVIDGIEAAQAEQVKAAVYPNPVSSELHVDVPYSEVATTMTLTDMQGRTVISRQLAETSNTVSVETLPAGMYLLRVEAGKSSKVFKIVVRH